MSRVVTFGARRFYHTSLFNNGKHANRLKLKTENQRAQFFQYVSFGEILRILIICNFRKKGRHMLLADHDIDSIFKLASKSSSSMLAMAKNPELTLKASQRVAYALLRTVSQAVQVVFETDSQFSCLEIMQVNHLVIFITMVYFIFFLSLIDKFHPWFFRS